MLWHNPFFNPHGIPDGVAKRRGVTARDVDPRELARGTEHELEHTTSRRIARQIALDHLAEDPKYYVKLARIEKNPHEEQETETARRMLSRYSSPKVAAEMAHFHAMDHPPGSTKRSYWQRVRDEILRLSKERTQRNPLSELWASSKDRYRASAKEKRMYGGSTVTEFYVGKKGDEDDASKWVVQVGYGKTPGERKTDAMRRAAPRLGVVP
jgi:hypothetical protein